MKLLRAGLLFFFLLLVAYFVLSSSWFLQAVVVPRAGRALDAGLSVGDVELSPFSELTLRQIKLTPNGAEPLFEAKLVHARYRLLDILRGNIVVEELTLESPVVSIVEAASGGSNLDALTRGSGGGDSRSKPAAPPRVDIQSVRVKNATLRHATTSRNGDTSTAELANVNITLTNLKNGRNGKLNVSAALAMGGVSGATASTNSLQGMFTGEFDFGLLDDLRPASVKALASISVGHATGAFADLKGLVARLDCDMTPAEVKLLSLRFHKGDLPLGEARLSGPFNAEKLEGSLKAGILSIDRRVLNLVGTAGGMDFGTTTINGASDITISHGGRMISAAGRVDVARLQFIRAGQTTPTLDLGLSFDAALDQSGKSLLLKAVNLTGTRNQQPLLTAALSRPMTLAFGDTVNAADASLDFALTGLDLEGWRAFAPVLDPGGIVNAKGRITARDGGRRLSAEIETTVTSFSAQLGGGPVSVSNITFQGLLDHTSAAESVSGRLALAGIKSAAATGEPFQAAFVLDASVSNQVAELRNCALMLTPTLRAKNELNLAGRVDFSDSSAMKGNLKLAAESLELTACYDLFAASPGDAATNQAASAVPPAPASNVEPPPVTLPLDNFTVEATVGRLLLRELDAANLQAGLLLDAGRVVIKPLQLTLNGAPVTASADLDLSLPGYKYAATFSADGVPVEPLANSFSPTYRGQAAGSLYARVDLKGAGVTGPGFRTNLAGSVDLNFTNANIQLVGPKVKAVLTPIAIALRAPQMLQSPLQGVTATLRAGAGRVEAPSLAVRSPAFRADSAGVILLADVLNDSPLNQPLELSLERGLAAKAGFSGVPTNQPYMRLPNFVQLTGTLGSPDAKIDKAVVAGLVATGIGSSLIQNVGGETAGKVGGALNTLGSLLGGKPAAGTNQPSATNPPVPANILDLFKKPKKP